MKNSELHPLVDADYILYRVGFAVKDDEPLEYALTTAKEVVNNIWDKFPDAPKGQMFLTGKNNFRDKIATLQVYKGNRDPSHKPKYYTELKEYLIKHHGAVVVQGMEAEDACGIRQFENKDRSTVIVGEDKDLLCIPGYHYNPIKDILIYVSLAEANEHFWTQVLMGDRVDNIRGIDGIGPKKAEKIIQPCGKEWNRMREAVLREYQRQHGDMAESAMDETAKLIWILREEGVTYNGSEINVLQTA